MTRKRSTELISVILHYGSLKALSKELGLSLQAVSKWDKVPFRHLFRISKETGIPRQILRPDIYEDDYFRPVDVDLVRAFWDMGFDTYEIALRTGFKELEVHKVISDYVERKQVERISDQDHRSSAAEHE